MRTLLRSYIFLYRVKSNQSQNAENQKYSTRNSTVSFGPYHCYHLNFVEGVPVELLRLTA